MKKIFSLTVILTALFLQNSYAYEKDDISQNEIQRCLISKDCHEKNYFISQMQEFRNDNEIEEFINFFNDSYRNNNLNLKSDFQRIIFNFERERLLQEKISLKRESLFY